MSNIDVYRGNLDGLPGPLVFRGLVQAGSTDSFERGDILNWNETTGYFTKVDAAADITYLLAFADEEIDADTCPAARYSRLIIPRPADLFEIPLAAAAAIAVGANYIPTGTTDQQATADADGAPVFTSVGQGNYPEPIKNGGTTVRSMANGLFTVNYEFSYYKKLVKLPGERMKIIALATSTTLLEEWSGAVIAVSSAAQIDLPQDCPQGTNFKIVAIGDVNVDVHSAGGGIYIKGAKQADSKYCRVADIGDFMEVVHYTENDWIAINSISGADGDITVES
jgi:hypothetical protein